MSPGLAFFYRNSTSKSVTFEIIATIDSIIETVTILNRRGMLDAFALKSLTSKLTEARDALARGNIKTAMNKLRDFIGQVKSQTGKHVAVDAAQLLTSDAQYVLAHL